jgi:hypothetical protein
MYWDNGDVVGQLHRRGDEAAALMKTQLSDKRP